MHRWMYFKVVSSYTSNIILWYHWLDPLSIGQVMDSSPVAGPLDALGFSENEDNRNTCLYRMPIVGYEVLEERSRFTVKF